MGFTQDYSDVPDWVEKPEGYKTDDMVKYEGNVFIANFWASKPGEGDANENGWRLYDELYDVTSSPAGAPARIIGYIPTWRKTEGFDYANAEMYRNVTHGIISFLMFSETDLGEFTPESVNDVDAIFRDVVITGHEYGTYISIALGGAVDYGFLSLMERIGSNPGDPVLQKAVKNVVDFVESHGLDGVDLDLECWWDKNSDPNKDQGGRLKSDGAHPAGKGLTEFAKQLKQAMPDKVISAALFATSWYGNCYDPGLVEYVDWLGIMTYDLTGSWDRTPVGPQTALLKIREQKTYAEEQQGEWPGNRKSSENKSDPMSDNPILSVEDSLWYWTNPFFTNWQGEGQNLARNKIAAGVPIYGYDFAYGKEPDDLSGQIAPGYKAVRYKDILSQFPDAATAANGNIKVPGNTPRPPFVSAGGTYPYAHNIYFETPDTAVTKLNFLKSVGAQGMIIWELSNDVWEGGKSVIQALYQNSGNPATRPALPSKIIALPVEDDSSKIIALPVEDDSSVEDGSSVGDDNFGEANPYDTGISPDIALNNGNVVVEVHKSQSHDTLWYHVGKVEGDKINWGGSVKYDNGVQPSVAITNDGLVVEVHKSENLDTLYYHIGRVEGDKINWGGSVKYDDGVEPSVAITDDGLVVEVHKSQGHDTLYYHVGRIEGDKINWGGSVKYDDGVQPSVAITNDGLVVEVHKSQSHDTLWYRGNGKVSDNTITWRNDNSQNYSNGEVPKVACNRELAVEAHKEGSDKLSYSVLTLPAFRSNWINLEGENSYWYCACNSATNDKQRHTSEHTMNIKEGAPYFYAVLTKDDNSTDFPTGAILTIEGPDGTKYDRDIQEENQLVIMSESSVRCLIVKDPKPGDWKMLMTVPEGVGFHCECNTVPSKDPYKTITTTLSETNQIQKRGLSNNGKTHDLGWYGLAGLWFIIYAVKDVAVDSAEGAMAGTAIGAGIGLAGGPGGVAAGAGAGRLIGTVMGVGEGLSDAVADTSRHMADVSQTYAAPPEEVRIATWNVFHGDLQNGDDPSYQQPRLPQLQDRVNELVNFGVQNNIGLITFQEMPQSVLNDPNHPILTNIRRNSNYDYVIVNSEYPSRSNINDPPPASATTDGYLILYNPTVFTLQDIAPGVQWQYFQPQLFLQGLAQARPPVQLRFQNQANGNVFDFLTWHTEPQRALARTYVQTAYDQLSQQQGNWILAGDLNIDDNNLPPGVVDPHHLTGDNLTLDHIITSGTAIDPEQDPEEPGRFTISQQQWGRFWSDAHYVLFGIVRFQ